MSAASGPARLEALYARPELVVFVLATIAYFAALVPGVLWMDVGELSAAAATLGGAHPPGHPGHSLLGKLATLVPIGEVATRLSMASALCAGAALAGVVALTRVFFVEERLLAMLVAAPVAMTPAVILNATRPEVYTPTFALLIWSMVFALRFVRAERGPASCALVCVLLLGLAATFHPAIATAAGVVIGGALILAARKRSLRLLPWALGLVVLAALVYLYLPVRALAADPPPLVWGDPSSGESFFRLVTASVYQGNFSGGSLAGRVLERLLLLGEGAGFALLFLGLTGLGFGVMTRLRGAGTLLVVVFAVVLGAATQEAFNPDMRAYLGLAYAALAVGVAILAAAAVRSLPQSIVARGSRAARASAAVAALPALLLAMFSERPEVLELDRSDDAMMLWDETVGRMPPGPGLFFANGDHLLFVAQYERLVAGARPEIAIVHAELARDRWFLEHVDELLPELFVPFVDDGVRGHTPDRLFVENARRGFNVAGDALQPASERPPRVEPLGRGYRFALTGPPTLGEPPPPLALTGFVGKRIAALTTVRRARFENQQGRRAMAARALGVLERFPPGVLDGPAIRPSLFEHLPWQASGLLVSGYEAGILADDLAWQVGLEAGEPGNASLEARTQHAWQDLLAGDLEAGNRALVSLGAQALAATTPMLIAIGRPDLAESRLRVHLRAIPKDADALALLASIVGNRADAAALDEAARLFEDAVAIAPDMDETWTRLGVVYAKQGRLGDARAAWTRALAINPDRGDVSAFLQRLDSDRDGARPP